jgi:hypothetical protein
MAPPPPYDDIETVRKGAELYTAEALDIFTDPTPDPALVELVRTDIAAFAKLVKEHVERLRVAQEESETRGLAATLHARAAPAARCRATVPPSDRPALNRGPAEQDRRTG